MPEKIKDRKIVILNQASNYLTIGFANAFKEQFEEVVLITGNIHEQGEKINDEIKIHKIIKYIRSPSYKKAWSYIVALFSIWYLLLTRYRRHEVFFVSVPPMGYLLNLILPHKFSMVIWDVYPDVFKITGMKESHSVYKIWSWLNKRSFKKAYKLFTISDRMADLIEKYVSKEKIIIQPIWSIFQENKKVEKKENVFITEHNLQNKFIVQYSGNIGLTHNVEELVEIASLMAEEKDIIFQIIGKGARKQYLKNLVKERELPNCMFLPFQSDEMFPFSLSASDVGVVILDEKTSKGSVPSKSYNLMSYGIPSLYIASKDSQLNLYAEKYQHAACFTKDEKLEVVEFLKQLKNEKSYYSKMSENAELASKDFRRNNANKFVEQYLIPNNK